MGPVHPSFYAQPESLSSTHGYTEGVYYTSYYYTSYYYTAGVYYTTYYYTAYYYTAHGYTSQVQKISPVTQM